MRAPPVASTRATLLTEEQQRAVEDPRTEGEPPLLSAVTARLRWRLLPVLWFAFLSCYILRNNLAFAGAE